MGHQAFFFLAAPLGFPDLSSLTKGRIEPGATAVKVRSPNHWTAREVPTKPFFFFLNKFIYLFWLHWVFVAVRRLSLVEVSGGYSLLRCAGFSLRRLLLLQSTGSRHVGFSSCGTWAQ